MPDDGLGELRRQYPGWTFWLGAHTHSAWAMPPGVATLVNADDVEQLAAKLAEHAAWSAPQPRAAG